MRNAATQTKPTPPLAAPLEQPAARWSAWWLALVLGLLTVALYWPATQHEFVFDDWQYVLENVHVTTGLSWANVQWAMSSGYAANWHPLTWFSHMADCQLYGVKPWGHHLTSVLFHAANAALVFGLLWQMTGARWRSWWVALFFAAHPLRVESVAWVAERKDVLSAFFGFLTLIFYVRYVRQTQGQKAASAVAKTPYARGNYWLALLFFTLGLLSKPMLVTWPFVLLLLDYWPLQRFELAGFKAQRSRLALLVSEKIPFFVLVVAASVVTFLVQRHAGAMAPVDNLPLGVRLGNALVAYGGYLEKLFWPGNLAVYYPYLGHWPIKTLTLTMALLVLVSALAYRWRRAQPFLLVGWCWYLGTLVPVIGLVQVGGQAMADRYTYLPTLGILVVVIWGAWAGTRRWRYQAGLLVVGGVVAAGLCLGLTRQQLSYWQDGETLFRRALQVTQKNVTAHRNLGAVLNMKGRPAESVQEYEAALRLDPGNFDVHNTLGNVLGRNNQTAAAIQEYEAALRLKPDFADAHNNLGRVLGSQGKFVEAIEHLQAALKLKPDDASVRVNLGNVLLQQGQLAEAVAQYQVALELKPEDADAHYNYGLALSKQGKLADSIREYQLVLKLKPEYVEAHFKLGFALNRVGEVKAAMSEFGEVLRLQPEHVAARYHLGTAQLNAGNAAAAVAELKEVIRLQPDHAEGHSNLGVAYLNQQRTELAVEEFSVAVRLRPEYAEAHNNLGTAYYQQGKYGLARDEFTMALKYKADYSSARDNLARAQAKLAAAH